MHFSSYLSVLANLYLISLVCAVHLFRGSHRSSFFLFAAGPTDPKCSPLSSLLHFLITIVVSVLIPSVQYILVVQLYFSSALKMNCLLLFNSYPRHLIFCLRVSEAFFQPLTAHCSNWNAFHNLVYLTLIWNLKSAHTRDFQI